MTSVDRSHEPDLPTVAATNSYGHLQSAVVNVLIGVSTNEQSRSTCGRRIPPHGSTMP